MHKLTLVAGAGLIALSGCIDATNFDPDAPDQNRTQQGALTGAAVGAITGLATGGDQKAKNAIVGAAIGAGAGALIGQRLDQQEADLRASLGNDQVRIRNTGSELIVTMPQDILFAIDSADLRPDLRRDLGALASNLQAYPDTTVDIVGHTDNTGDAGYNQALSQRRANAVSGELIANGVSSSRIRAFGRGEAEPVADNLTPEGRAQNRRVDIIIRPNAA
ncbi:OmpA family protein [Shimia ponticola]|uniref:OmpA family protein n=1 Tax=Shimia ponticola TaxID=2582893 RepID=UPI0011BE0DB0|nr:OmpA family protein [Shimia ponticola]